MKKLLLSFALAVTAFSAFSAEYTVFDISNPGTWTGDVTNGWENKTTVDGKTFSFKYERGDAKSDQELMSPVGNTFAWRMYKGTKVTLKAEGVAMTKITFTYDDYNSGQYIGSMVLSSGWSGTLESTDYTVVSAGLSELVCQASDKQVRIKKIVVSDEGGVAPPPVDPGLPEGIIYQNAFNENLDGWDKINDTALSDFNGWKINNNEPKCAICNSYYGGTNHPADAKMQKTFDLTNYYDTELEFEQAFGYDFPTSQNDNYRLYVVSNGATYYLDMATFPAVPDSNWSTWVSNVFDLSEYDGQQLTIGFEYSTDGSVSRAWELRNFTLRGKSLASIAEIETEDMTEPVYYTLQGVRVENPSGGLYIKVTGTKATKVLF